MGAFIINGAHAGGFSPLSVAGVLVHDIALKNGFPISQGALFTASFAHQSRSSPSSPSSCSPSWASCATTKPTNMPTSTQPAPAALTASRSSRSH